MARCNHVTVAIAGQQYRRVLIVVVHARPPAVSLIDNLPFSASDTESEDDVSHAANPLNANGVVVDIEHVESPAHRIDQRCAGHNPLTANVDKWRFAFGDDFFGELVIV